MESCAMSNMAACQVNIDLTFWSQQINLKLSFFREDFDIVQAIIISYVELFQVNFWLPNVTFPLLQQT